MHIATKFHHLMLNHSKVIMLTNKQTNKKTSLKASTLLCYANTHILFTALWTLFVITWVILYQKQFGFY